MDILKTLLLTVAICTTSACAVDDLSHAGTFLPTEQNRKLLATPPCCATYSDMTFKPLEIGTLEKTLVVTTNPVFEFNSTKSYFVAYQLPPRARTLTVKTYPVNLLLNPTGHIFVPSVVLLDGSKQKISDYAPRLFPMRPRVIGDSWAEATIRLPEGASYVILYDGKSAGAVGFEDSDKRSGVLYVRPGPTGRLEITVE